MPAYKKVFSAMLVFLICFAFGIAANNKVYSKDYGLKSEETVNITVYERIHPAVVLVEAQLPDGISSGTGCIINSRGIILTSFHVIKKSPYIEVTTSSGETYKAELLSSDIPSGDLALLKIKPQKPLPVVKFGDSSAVKVGQKVLAIGNPFGFNGTLTTGIISRIDYERNKIQTDAAINPGSSGGPVLNADGEVIGISQSIFNPDNNKSNIGIGFAIPSNEAKKMIKNYIK